MTYNINGLDKRIAYTNTSTMTLFNANGIMEDDVHFIITLEANDASSIPLSTLGPGSTNFFDARSGGSAINRHVAVLAGPPAAYRVNKVALSGDTNAAAGAGAGLQGQAFSGGKKTVTFVSLSTLWDGWQRHVIGNLASNLTFGIDGYLYAGRFVRNTGAVAMATHETLNAAQANYVI